MKMIKDLYFELSNKKVEIYTKAMGTEMQEKYVGTVVGCYSTGQTFLVLDTKELINIKYIAMIKILD
jgi:hypothetical protein